MKFINKIIIEKIFGFDKFKKRLIKKGPLKDSFYYGSFLDGRYFNSFEPEIVETIKKIYQQGNIYDIGAHFGFYSLLFSRLVKNGRVYSFEPNPYCLEKLKKTVEINGFNNLIKILNFGLGEKDQEREMMVLLDNLARSTCDQGLKDLYKNKSNHLSEKVKIKIRALDNLDLPGPGLIKIDVEGLEAMVIRGALKTINKYHPDLIIEIHGRNQELSQEKAEYLSDLLSGFGYQAFHIESKRFLEDLDVVPAGGHFYFSTKSANSKKSGKVSVIIPTYNRENFLKRAIRSVLNQTFQDFELIVVDDGSDDNTKEAVGSFNNDKIKYIYRENSGGGAKPKNAGIKIAQGNYIAILDDDDEWLPEKLEKQVRFLDEHQDIAVAGCNYFIKKEFEELGSFFFIKGTEFLKEYKIPEYKDLFKRLLVTDDMGPGSTMVYRKEVFEKVGLFDENLKSGQDKEMRIRLAEKRCRFGFIREPLVIYNTGHNNISFLGLSIEEREKDWEYIFNKYRKYYQADKNLFSNKLRYDGTRYMLLGLPRKARKSFLFSIKKNPLNVKACLYFLLSFLGFSCYYKLNKIKYALKSIFS